MLPVTLTSTGFNHDVVVENTVSAPPYTNYAVEYNTGEGTAFYQTNLAGAARTNGLPLTGLFTNANDGTIFQFQPYTASNALILNPTTALTNGTLFLATPRAYDSIAILANSGNGDSTGTASLTIHFNDGTTLVTNYHAPDWFNNNSGALYTVALQGVQRMNLTSGAVSGQPTNPRFYQTAISLAGVPGATNKLISSLTFGKATGTVSGSANTTGIFALSGATNASQSNVTFTVATVTNLPATGIQAQVATLRGQVLSMGNDAPVITAYYGTTDGGTNPAAWASSVSLGWQTGVFAQAVSGLSFNTNYYFTFRAVNAAGTNWAAPSLTFATLVPSLAIVTNLPATGIQTKAATLNGQVLSTGNDVPVISLFYGTTDGGTNPAAWSNSVGFGVQTGAVAQAVSGLSYSTTYYFAFRAVNVAGTNWAGPSRSFATLTPSPATVTNFPASGIRADSAELNGQVLASGGDTPSLTFFYGPVNGGTNPAAWAKSIPLGLQTGFFARGIFGLTANTTYYSSIRAVNGGGTAWTTPVQSFVTLASNPAAPLMAVLTQHNDNNRSGDNLNETALNAGNINTNTFGLIYTRPVDDQIYAQPLVATNVTIPAKGVHNVVYVATVNNSVYAFDADDPTVVTPYWQTNFLGTFGGTNVLVPVNSDMNGACNPYRDFSGNIGIVGTPVIDPATQIMYLVVRTKEIVSLTTNFVQRLYALDITTGTNRLAPVIISGSYGGVTFDPQKNNQRTALTLANGNVFMGWSSHCDWGPYHGWVMAYNAATLAQVAVYADTTTGSQGGIWMSGQGPAADSSGNIFVSTGNGTVGSTGNPSDTTNRGMSFLKLSGADLSIMTWFTPYNYSFLNGGDWDLGAGGIMLIPGTSLAIGGGKSSSSVPANLYVVNRDNMGGVSLGTSDTNIVQAIPVTPTGLGFNHIHGAPVWWDGPDGSYTYVWGESDHFHQYQFDKVNGVFITPAYSQSPTPAWVNGMTGGMLAVSANGTNAGSGILWAAHQFTGDANQAVRPGIMHAYDAQNVTNELWNSEQYSARDSVGLYAKFVPPTVANSKVYLATFSGRLNVYGLLPAGRPLIYQLPQPTARYAGDHVTLAVASGGSSPLTFQWKLNGTNISGATASTYTLGNAQFANAGTYTCSISNSFGVTNTPGALLTIVPTPTISYAQVVMADNPIAYWRLDETNGTVAHDSVGGHDGQYLSANLGFPGYNPKDPNTAVEFGTNRVNSVAITDSYVGNIFGIDFSTFVNNATFSVEAWVNGEGMAQASGAGIVTYGYGGGGEQFNLDCGSGSSSFRFSIRDAINIAHNANGNIGASNTNAWRHVVGVCDEPNGLVLLYVNGVLNASAAMSNGLQMGTSPLSIGSRQASFSSTYTSNFKGLIDEVAIYPYALNAAQVQNHFLAASNPVVTLYMQAAGTNVVFTWSPGTLQSAPTAIGPYTDIPTATAPYIVPVSATQQFYRVRVK